MDNEELPALAAPWHWMADEDCDAVRYCINRAMIFGLPAGVKLYQTNYDGLPAENSQFEMRVCRVQYNFVVCGWRPRVTFDARSLFDAAYDIEFAGMAVDETAARLRTPRGINQRRQAFRNRLLKLAPMLQGEMQRITDACRDPRRWARPILPSHDIVGVFRPMRKGIT